MHGRDHGVAILSEGLAEKLDLESLGPVEHDQYGNVRLAELDLGRVLKDRVAGRLRERKVDVTIVGKDLGCELLWAAPGAADIQYRRGLGYWATLILLVGVLNAKVAIQT